MSAQTDQDQDTINRARALSEAPVISDLLAEFLNGQPGRQGEPVTRQTAYAAAFGTAQGLLGTLAFMAEHLHSQVTRLTERVGQLAADNDQLMSDRQDMEDKLNGR